MGTTAARPVLGLIIITFALVALSGGCSTTQVTPMPELPEVPSYAKVPHPESPDIHEIRAIFSVKGAPPPDRLNGCTKDFDKLRGLVQGQDELKQGARELVGMWPEDYHWCFYWQMIQLDDRLKELVYHDERQAEVVKTYGFLAPVARAFRDQYKDTRYLRSAAYQYKNVSQRVFLRKLTLTVEGAQDLFVGAGNEPNGLWQAFKPGEAIVLEKYGFLAPPPADPAAQALPPAPAPEAAPAAPLAAEPAAAPPPPTLGEDVWAPTETAPDAAQFEAPVAPATAEPAELIGRQPADAQDWQSEFQQLEGSDAVTTETRVTEGAGAQGPAPASVPATAPGEPTAAVQAPAQEFTPDAAAPAEGADSTLDIDFEAGQDFPGVE